MARTRFVAVTRTGNECDIIEPFVRHHAALFDRLLIIDDESSDGTWAILERLRDEGLPLTLFRAAEVDWPQTAFTTRLMHLAFDEFDADWVAPIDADEFVEAPAGKGLEEILPPARDLLAMLRWSNFAWHRSIDESERNPVVRMRMRMPPRTDSYKTIIPRDALAGDRDASLLPGNHGLARAGGYADLLYCRDLPLCHYPVRSIQQFVSKSVINYLRYAALPRHGRPMDGFQYARPFDLAKGPIEQLLPQIVEEMERMSPVYAMQDGGQMVGEPAERPLDYRGGPLTLSAFPASALTNIVNLAERLARRVSALETELGLPSGL